MPQNVLPVISPPVLFVSSSRAVLWQAKVSNRESRCAPICQLFPIMALAGQISTQAMQSPHLETPIGVAVGNLASVRMLPSLTAEPNSSVMSRAHLPIQPRPAWVATVFWGSLVVRVSGYSAPGMVRGCASYPFPRRNCATALPSASRRLSARRHSSTYELVGPPLISAMIWGLRDTAIDTPKGKLSRRSGAISRRSAKPTKLAPLDFRKFRSSSDRVIILLSTSYTRRPGRCSSPPDR